MGSILFMFLHVSKMKGIISLMIFALTYVMFCEVLRLSASSIWACWSHTMFKSCQYATNNFKICVNLTSISTKKHNQFCEKPSLKPRKIVKDNKNDSKHVNLWLGMPPCKLKILRLLLLQKSSYFKRVLTSII